MAHAERLVWCESMQLQPMTRTQAAVFAGLGDFNDADIETIMSSDGEHSNALAMNATAQSCGSEHFAGITIHNRSTIAPPHSNSAPAIGAMPACGSYDSRMC